MRNQSDFQIGDMRWLVLLFLSIVILSCQSDVPSETETIEGDSQQDSLNGEDSLVQEDNSFSDLPDTVKKWHQWIDSLEIGDVNHDGMVDSAIVFSPLINETALYECADDSCMTFVQFNFTDELLMHTGAIGFIQFWNAGDLNDDGYDELGVIPDWFTSCWSALYVYSHFEDGWKPIGVGSVYNCIEDDYSWRVKKINSEEF